MRVDQPVDQPDIAPIDAGLHAGHGVAADHLLGAVDGDARQQGRGLVQRLDGQIGARRDHAAVEIAVLGHDVEIGGGAEIHHDHRALVALMRRHRVAQPVGAHRFGPVDIGLDAQVQRRIAHQQRLGLEIFAAHVAQIEQHRRHHRGDDGGIQVGEGQAFQRQQLAQPHGIFVGGAR